MAQIFLSYAREDRECAALFARELSARGWTVWWDRRIQVGRSFSEVIERELDDARCVIVLWSRHAVASPWVQTEVSEAGRRRVLVPVRIEDVRLPLEFRSLHTADLFEWRTQFDGPELDDCLASIELHAPKNIGATLSEQPAAEPQQITGASDAQKVIATVQQKATAPAVVEPHQTASTAIDQEGPANVDRRPAVFWISQDGRQSHAPDLVTLCKWVEEGKIRTDSQVYDPSLQQWILAQEVAGLESVWQKRTAALPAANRGRIITLAIVGAVLLFVLIIASVAKRPSSGGTEATDTIATNIADTMSTETMSTDTMSTDTMATDTMATDTMATDTMATAAISDTATSGKIAISLQNECTKTIRVAICYRDSAGTWIITGWFDVEASQTVSNVVQAYGPNVYFYGKGDEGRWEGKEGEDAMISSQPVDVNNNFYAVVGSALKGEEIQTVPFIGRTVDAGQSVYTVRFVCK